MNNMGKGGGRVLIISMEDGDGILISKHKNECLEREKKYRLLKKPRRRQMPAGLASENENDDVDEAT